MDPCNLKNHTGDVSPDGGVLQTLVINGPVFLVALLLFCIKQRYFYVPPLDPHPTYNNMDEGDPERSVLKALDDDISHHQIDDDDDDPLARPDAEYYEKQHRQPYEEPINESHVVRLLSDSGENLDETTLQRWTPSWFNWAREAWDAPETEIEKYGGKDALDYLRFQKMLILILTIMCVPAIGIILPINWTGDRGFENFSRSTIMNIIPGSPRLWAHTIVLIFNTWVCFFCLRNYAQKLVAVVRTRKFRRAIILRNVADGSVDTITSLLLQFCRRLVKENELTDVQVVPELSEVFKFTEKMKKERQTIEHYQYLADQLGAKILRYRYGCFGPRYDVLAEAHQRLNEYRLQRDRAWREGLASHSGTAFITFNSRGTTASVLKALRDGYGETTPFLEVTEWRCSLAPHPREVLWQNLGVTHGEHVLREVVINIVLGVILILWTTPVSIMASLDNINNKLGIRDSLDENVFLESVLPPFLLFALGSLLPFFIIKSNEYEKHLTTRSRDYNLIIKSMVYGFITHLILPALLLTSADAIIILIADGRQFLERLECVFLPSNGAFFVNLMLNAALFGTGIRLAPIFETFAWIKANATAVTPREKMLARKPRSSPISYGMKYGNVCSMFAAILAFANASPITVPAGLFFMLFSYYFDKLFILKTARRTDNLADGRLINVSMNSVFVSILLYQILTLIYMEIQLGGEAAQTVLIAMTITLSALLFLGKLCGFKRIFQSPVILENADGPTAADSEHVNAKGFYLAPLLAARQEQQRQAEPAPHDRHDLRY